MTSNTITLHPAVADAQRIGIRPTLWLASCGDAKVAHDAPARELYSGDLTRKQIAFASTRGSALGGPAACMILSARHGVVALDAELAPYDQRLDRMTAGELADWRAMVVEQLADAGCLDATIFLMAGARYERELRLALADTDARIVMAFGSSMEIGHRRSWLKKCSEKEQCDAIGKGVR